MYTTIQIFSLAGTARIACCDFTDEQKNSHSRRNLRREWLMWHAQPQPRSSFAFHARHFYSQIAVLGRLSQLNLDPPRFSPGPEREGHRQTPQLRIVEPHERYYRSPLAALPCLGKDAPLRCAHRASITHYAHACRQPGKGFLPMPGFEPATTPVPVNHQYHLATEPNKN